MQLGWGNVSYEKKVNYLLYFKQKLSFAHGCRTNTLSKIYKPI